MVCHDQLAELLRDPVVTQCPYPLYDQMRATDPVLDVAGIGRLVSRFEDVVEILDSPDNYAPLYGAGFATTGRTLNPRPPAVDAILAEGVREVPVLSQVGGPTHDRHRRLVSQAFSARRIEQLEDVIRATGEELLHPFAKRGTVAMRSEFAGALPVAVIAQALGVPRVDLDVFKRWSHGAQSLIGADIPEDRYIEVAKDLIEFQRYFSAHIEQRRENPADDLLSDLVHAVEPGDAPLDEAELLNIIMQILIAGNETTTNALCAGMHMLARQPGLAEQLRSDPATIPQFVEELLRLESPIQGLPRVTLVDVELRGVQLPRGTTVVPLYGAANRDQGRFPDPGQVKLDRERITDHLAFSRGAHRCLGADLARAELRISLETLLSRMQHIRVATDQEPEQLPSTMVRGVKELHLAFEPVTISIGDVHPRGGLNAFFTRGRFYPPENR